MPVTAAALRICRHPVRACCAVPVLLALALGGCGEPEARTALPPAEIPVRNPTAPIASQTDATAERLGGRWIVVAGAGIRPGTRLRLSAGRAVVDDVAMTLEDRGQGRLVLGGEAVWVHWLDADARTAALGAPSGRRVWIMDRTGRPEERLAAARRILDWYGYDLDRLAGP
jgi:apolipoprotein D and lipocalin family protein